MIDTAISWADDTVNPWQGCVKVSEACRHCYAEALDARFRPGGETHWGPTAPRLIRVEKAIAELEAIARRGEKEGRLRRVFIASMSDVFEDHTDLVEPRKRLWDALHLLAGERPRLTPMLLTKRPEVMAAWAQEHGWPAGAWAGTTVENQERTDERVPHLLRVPARIRFLSCEPILDSIDLGNIDWNGSTSLCVLERAGASISWIVAGGESGAHARPSHPAWFRSLRDQCVAAGVPFHFKQWGEWGPKGGNATRPFDCAGGPLWRVGKHAAGRLLDGRTWDELPP